MRFRKIQNTGVHHITITGADRQTPPSIFLKACLAIHYIFEPTQCSDPPTEGNLYFDPGAGRLIPIFTNEERKLDANASALHPPRQCPGEATATRIVRVTP